MKNLLVSVFVLCSLVAQAQSGFVIGQPEPPNYSGRLELTPDKGGNWNTRIKGGPVIPLKVNPVSNRLVNFKKSIDELRSDTTRFVLAPRIVMFDDTLQTVMFRLDSLSTAPDDSATTILTVSGNRYTAVFPDREISLLKIGAKGNGVVDDWKPIQKAFNKGGNLAIYAPAGRYRVSKKVLRYNKGSLVFIGAGAGRTIFEFYNDTDGFEFVNPLNGNYGTMVFKDVEVRSTGPKSPGRFATKMTTQHECFPGVIANDIAYKGTTVGHEWTYGLYLFDCSRNSIKGITSVGASQSVTSAIMLENTMGRPMVEHNITDVNLQTGKYALQSQSHGYPGIEGIVIGTGTVAGTGQAVRAEADYPAPGLHIIATHMEVQGKPAIYTRNINQVFLVDPFLYINKHAATGEIPTSAVYFENAVNVIGSFYVNLGDSTKHVVELAGSGGKIDLDVHGDYKWSKTYLYKATSSYENQATFGVYSSWIGGLGFNGVAQTLGVVGSPLVQYKPSFRSDAANPPLGSLIFYGPNGGWQPGATHRVVRDNVAYTSASSYTVNVALTNAVEIANGPSSMTVVIPVDQMLPGQNLTIMPYPNSTGTITITTTNTVNNKILDPETNVFATSITLPYYKGRVIQLVENGGGGQLQIKAISSNVSGYVSQSAFNSFVSSTTNAQANYLVKSNNLSDIANPATARANLALQGMALQSPSSVTITGGSVNDVTFSNANLTNGSWTNGSLYAVNANGSFSGTHSGTANFSTATITNLSASDFTAAGLATLSTTKAANLTVVGATATNTLSVTTNASVGGTLSSSALSTSALSVSGNASFSGSAVLGNVVTGTLSATGNATIGSVATGNLSASGTVGLGTVTATSVTTNGNIVVNAANGRSVGFGTTGFNTGMTLSFDWGSSVLYSKAPFGQPLEHMSYHGFEFKNQNGTTKPVISLKPGATTANLDWYNQAGTKVGQITNAGDVELLNTAQGVILVAPDGHRVRITVNNSNVLVVTPL